MLLATAGPQTSRDSPICLPSHTLGAQELQTYTYCAQLYMGSGDSNSGLLIAQQASIYMEPSPQPLARYFQKG